MNVAFATDAHAHSADLVLHGGRSRQRGAADAARDVLSRGNPSCRRTSRRPHPAEDLTRAGRRSVRPWLAPWLSSIALAACVRAPTESTATEQSLTLNNPRFDAARSALVAHD